MWAQQEVKWRHLEEEKVDGQFWLDMEDTEESMKLSIKYPTHVAYRTKFFYLPPNFDQDPV